MPAIWGLPSASSLIDAPFSIFDGKPNDRRLAGSTSRESRESRDESRESCEGRIKILIT